MAENSPEPPQKRSYPAFFEKTIPIAIGVLILIIFVMLIFAVAVIMGVF
jgi:hypothetical protein